MTSELYMKTIDSVNVRDRWYVRLTRYFWPKERSVIGTTYQPSVGAHTLSAGDLFIILPKEKKEQREEIDVQSPSIQDLKVL